MSVLSLKLRLRDAKSNHGPRSKDLRKVNVMRAEYDFSNAVKNPYASHMAHAAMPTAPSINHCETTMILDHIGITVSNTETSKAFFTAALAPLGITLIMETHGWVGFGRNGKPDFWFGAGGEVQRPMHLAFAARSRDEVREFYSAALAAGAKDNGQPGPRPQYHANYYGAFVIGPDGHNVEAVCHTTD